MDVIYRTSVLLGTVYDALGSHSHSVCSSPWAGKFPPVYQRGQRWGWGEGRQRAGDGTPCSRKLGSELPASLGISLGSFPLSCSQILPSVQIRFFCLDFLLTTLAYFSFPPLLFLSQSFSPLFFSLCLFLQFIFPLFLPFLSQFSVVFFPAQ